MIVKHATQVGNPIIRSKAKSVKNITSKETKKIIKDLVDSMHYHALVGMAAPQIGKSLRVFVTEIRQTKNRKPKDLDPIRVFINPEITYYSKKVALGYEGCGSVASSELFGKVPRSESIVIKAYNEKGEPFEFTAQGLLARVIQHEQDHIEGKVFLDRITDTESFMSRNEYRAKFKK
ncbi:MAG: peptide deformylase [Patescibacteria group bacterium]